MLGTFFILRTFCLWTNYTKYSIITSLFGLNIEKFFDFFEKTLLLKGEMTDIVYVNIRYDKSVTRGFTYLERIVS